MNVATKQNIPDLELIQKIIAGQVELFEVLIRTNNALLYKTGRAYGYCHEDTQDLMQETFIKVYVNLSKFENRSSFKTWIMKIMLNNCFQKQQKFSFKNEKTSIKAIHENLSPMYASHHTDTSKQIINRELNHIIENSLVQLPVDYRMVFSLREITGLSIAETADALSISEANVKVRLNRAKAMLRKEIEKKYTTEDIFEFNLIYCNLIVDRVMNKIKELI